MAAPSSTDKTPVNTSPKTPLNIGAAEESTGKPIALGFEAVSLPPYGLIPSAPSEFNQNDKFVANESGASSAVYPNVSSLGGDLARTYYAAPPNTSSSGINGYTPLQPAPNPLPPYTPSQAENQGPVGATYPMPIGAPTINTPPITTQPTGFGPLPPISTGVVPIEGQPITTQPLPVGVPNINYDTPPMGPTEGWMAPPPLFPVDCPPGLEYLTTIDSFFIKQKVELFEAFTGFETNNKYSIRNKYGDKVYYVLEDNNCCNRNCCGNLRSFDLRVFDKSGNEIILITRDLRCDSCLFPCCLQELNVYAPPGNFVGSVVQKWTMCQPKFDIKDDTGNTVLKIEGPSSDCCMCGNVDFQVLSKNKEAVVGKISKQWSGLAREFFTDADNYGISFPLDLAVRVKAVMIGACFLIDFMYFETNDSGPLAAFASGLECGNACLAAGSGNCCECDCDGCCEGGDCDGCCDGGGGDGCCDGGGGDGCCDGGGGDGCCDGGGGDGCCDGGGGDGCCDGGGGGDCGDCGDC